MPSRCNSGCGTRSPTAAVGTPSVRLNFVEYHVEGSSAPPSRNTWQIHKKLAPFQRASNADSFTPMKPNKHPIVGLKAQGAIKLYFFSKRTSSLCPHTPRKKKKSNVDDLSTNFCTAKIYRNKPNRNFHGNLFDQPFPSIRRCVSRHWDASCPS